MSTFGSDSESVEEKVMLNGRTSYYQQAEMHHSLREKSLGQFSTFQRHIAGGDTPLSHKHLTTRGTSILYSKSWTHMEQFWIV